MGYNNFEKDLELSFKKELLDGTEKAIRNSFKDVYIVKYVKATNIQLGLGLDAIVVFKSGKRITIELKLQPHYYYKKNKFLLEETQQFYSDKDYKILIEEKPGNSKTVTAEYFMFLVRDEKDEVILESFIFSTKFLKEKPFDYNKYPIFPDKGERYLNGTYHKNIVRIIYLKHLKDDLCDEIIHLDYKTGIDIFKVNRSSIAYIRNKSGLEWFGFKSGNRKGEVDGTQRANSI
jgi:hypothetical protein